MAHPSRVLPPGPPQHIFFGTSKKDMLGAAPPGVTLEESLTIILLTYNQAYAIMKVWKTTQTHKNTKQ